MIEDKEMKKKTLTIEDIEEKMKSMGGVEVSEKEFDNLEEYKGISNYVKLIFGENKGHKRNKILKTKTLR